MKVAQEHRAKPRYDTTGIERFRHAQSLAARLAIVLAVIYAIPHIWWGLGVDWLAPGEMGSDDGLGSHPVITFAAFYGMGALALWSAHLAWAMTGPRPSWYPGWFIALHGWGIGILLVIRGGIGLAETSLILAGERDCPFMGCRGSEPGRDAIGLTGAFWEPLFMVWGVALLVAVACWTVARRRS